jgi:hypothetical protein
MTNLIRQRVTKMEREYFNTDTKVKPSESQRTYTQRNVNL